MKIIRNIVPSLKVVGRRVKDRLFPYRVAAEAKSTLSNGGSKTVMTLANRFGEQRTLTVTVENVSEEEVRRVLGDNFDLKG